MVFRQMEIGAKLRELRVAKNLSQGDIEKRTGLLRAYTSRVEHGHTVPSIGTLEKYANALGVPLYRFFTDEESLVKLKLPRSDDGSLWGSGGKERGAFQKLAKALSRMDNMAQGMARRGQSRDPLRAMRPGVYWRPAAKIEFQTARIQGGQDE